MKMLLFIALFAGAANAVTYSTEIESSFQCNYDGNQQEMNACALRDYKEADTVLNETYKRTLAQLPASKQAELRRQQKTWLKNRDPQCKDAAKQFDGGSMWPLQYFSCLKDATEARNKVVAQWVREE